MRALIAAATGLAAALALVLTITAIGLASRATTSPEAAADHRPPAPLTARTGRDRRDAPQGRA